MKVIKQQTYVDQPFVSTQNSNQSLPIEFRLKSTQLSTDLAATTSPQPQRLVELHPSQPQKNEELSITIPSPEVVSPVGKKSESKGIKSWSEDDRPREKLESKGVAALSNSELLAILIRNGSKDRSAVEVSKEILNLANNNLFELGRMDYGDFLGIMGVGKVKAITITAALELGRRRHLQSREEKNQILSSQDAYREIGAALMDIDHEQFWVIYLDSKSRVIKKKQIGKGGVSKVYVECAFIFREAIINKAKAMILVHNHPSGQVKPSREDVKLTNKIKNGCEMFSLTLSDHIIVGDQGYFSFLDDNML